MQQEAESLTLSDTPEVPTLVATGNYGKAEPQMSCGDSQQTDPKRSYGLEKAVPGNEQLLSDEPGFCSTGDERMATFNIGEQCLTGIIPPKPSTYELSQVRHKSATFPSDTKERLPVNGPAHLPVRPKSPDCVLPSVARASSPLEVIKPKDTIDSLFSAPWGSTLDQETSLWLPDVSITPLDRIGSSEYQHTTKPKPVGVISPADLDHTCSAVCADDPACVTYHTMAETIVSEMPGNDDKGHLLPAVKSVNQERPIKPSADRVSSPKVVVNANSPKNKKRSSISVNTALYTAYITGTSAVVFHRAGVQSVIQHSLKKAEETAGHDTKRHCRNGYCIPMYVPARCTTFSALTMALSTSTAFVFGKNAFQHIEHGKTESDKSQKAKNGDPEITRTETMNVPNDGENPEIKDTRINVAVKPIVGSLMWLSGRRHDNSTCTGLSSLLVTTTAMVLGDAVENTCVEFTEIDLSDKVPEKKVNKQRSLVDILLCRRRK